VRAVHELVALGQPRPVEEIVVVDNASTDGTAAAVRAAHPDVALLALEENVGGAGGFHAGMAQAHAAGHGWLWIMDDDTLPEPGALAALLAGAERAPGPSVPPLLASQVLWKDGSLHPMNRPFVRWREPGTVATGAEHGLVALRSATFVSLAIRREAVDRFGLPLREYFIWGDDFEYTNRLLRDTPGYLVPESRVLHWTDRPHTSITGARERFYYHVRNSLLVLRGSSMDAWERLSYLRYWAGTLKDYLRIHGHSRQAWAIVLRGLRDGCRGSAR